MPAPRFVGSAVKRLEDPRLIRGQAQYVDDLTVPGTLHTFVLRSPHSHARLTHLDVSEALKQPGVLAILTGKDVAGKVRPCRLAPDSPEAVVRRFTPRPTAERPITPDYVGYAPLIPGKMSKT